MPPCKRRPRSRIGPREIRHRNIPDAAARADQGLALIFGANIDAHDLTGRRNSGDDDGPTADTAVFDVLLASHRAVHDELDGLPAVRTLNECGLKILHLGVGRLLRHDAIALASAVAGRTPTSARAARRSLRKGSLEDARARSGNETPTAPTVDCHDLRGQTRVPTGKAALARPVHWKPLSSNRSASR